MIFKLYLDCIFKELNSKPKKQFNKFLSALPKYLNFGSFLNYEREVIKYTPYPVKHFSLKPFFVNLYFTYNQNISYF